MTLAPLSLPRDRPMLHVAFLGHAGHGKSTLLAALSHRLVQRPEAVSVALRVDGPRLRPVDASTGPGAAPSGGVWAQCVAAASARRRYAFHDLPGSRRYLREASRALGLRDAAVVVVSAADAARAQTREHVLHARGLEARQTLVFVNACDAVDDPAWLDAVEADAREALLDAGVEGDAVRVLRGSATRSLANDPRWTPTVDALLDALDGLDDVPHDPDGPLVLPVSESYPGRARGLAVVVGRVGRGRVTVGDVVQSPGVGDYVVRSLEQHGRPVPVCEAGELAGLGLGYRGATNRAPRRGDVVATPDTLTLRSELVVTLHLVALPGAGRHTPLRSGMRGFFHFGTAGRMGVVRLPQGFDSLAPGARCTLVRVRLERPAWVAAGMRFAFRDGSVGPRGDDSAPLLWGGTAGAGEVL